jgi:hypothetical protein
MNYRLVLNNGLVYYFLEINDMFIFIRELDFLNCDESEPIILEITSFVFN